MSVTAGIQYYWLNTELVLLLLLKNQGDRLDPRPRSHSFKGMGRPPAEGPTARGQDAPVGAGDPREVWRQGNSCLPCIRAFQMSGGSSTVQRERSVKTPGPSPGFPGSFHRSACAVKLLSPAPAPRGRQAHVGLDCLEGKWVHLRDVRTTCSPRRAW